MQATGRRRHGRRDGPGLCRSRVRVDRRFRGRVGAFERAACKADANHLYDTYDGALTYGDYMMSYDGVTDTRDGTEVEHALEMAATVAWANYFDNLLGLPDPALKTLATNLCFTFDIGDNYWIRPAGPSAGKPALAFWLTAGVGDVRADPCSATPTFHNVGVEVLFSVAPPDGTQVRMFVRKEGDAGPYRFGRGVLSRIQSRPSASAGFLRNEPLPELNFTAASTARNTPSSNPGRSYRSS